MERLLTLKYYFSTQPDPNFQFTKVTVVLIVLFFVLCVAIKIYRNKYAKDPIIKKIIKRYPGKLFMFGSILLFLLLVREAGVPVVSMRIWWFLLLIYVIYWAVKILLNFKKEYRRRSKQMNSHAVQSKYLPKKKKR